MADWGSSQEPGSGVMKRRLNYYEKLKYRGEASGCEPGRRPLIMYHDTQTKTWFIGPKALWHSSRQPT